MDSPTHAPRKPRRAGDAAGICILAAALVLMGAGYVRAQSQESINAVTDVKVSALIERVQKLETSQTYGLGALVLNLFAHLVQINGNRRGRRGRPEGDS